MEIQSLFLHHFRVYRERHFDFAPKINTICGPNAIGKTSVLEALSVLMCGRSFRSPQTTDLIRTGEPYFHLELKFIKHGIEQVLRLTYSHAERRIVYNQTAYQSASSLLGLIPGVVMTPDDASLVKGAPGIRRQFLDMHIAQVDPLYLHHLTRYQRAMRQRNALLRLKQVSTMDSWEYEMAKAATYITNQRELAIRELTGSTQGYYCSIGGRDEELSLSYKSGAPEQDRERYYLDQYQKSRSRDMVFGLTATGPHKDDLLIAIQGKDARYFSSEGQQRTCVAALRLSEWSRLRNLADTTPIMLIDDAGLSMDGSRRRKLFDLLSQMGQVFITCTEPPVLSHDHQFLIHLN